MVFVETGTTYEESRISEYSINNLNSIQYNKHYLTYGLSPLFGNLTQSTQAVSGTTQNLYMIIYNTTDSIDNGTVVGNFTEASVYIYQGNQPQFSTLYDYENID